MKKLFVLVIVVLLVNVALANTIDTFGIVPDQFTIEFVDIFGSASNPDSGYGNVNGDYRMGMLEISNAQFAKFASNNPYFTDGGVPANNVTWFEAAKFVNFLNTSTNNQAAYKFSGNVMGVWQDGEDGYDASNPYRNSNAKYFLPTEDEWVKAAYWNGTNLQTYANASANDLVSGSPDPAKWNYSTSAGNEPWNVGSGSEELNGTKNMMGNVWEWMESPYYSGDYLSSSNRGTRGGSFYSSGVNYLSSSYRGIVTPNVEYYAIGFRVASVPEPATLLLLGLGGLMLRRRKA